MEREDPYASILETCTPSCSHGGLHFGNNPLFPRPPEGVSGDQLLPYGPIPEESLGNYFCYTPPEPGTTNNHLTNDYNEEVTTHVCVVSYQDSPPSLEGSDDYQFLRIENFDYGDSGFEDGGSGTMVSFDGDCTNTQMADASILLLSRLKSLAVSSQVLYDEGIYSEVFSFFTDFRISVFPVQHDTRHSSKKRNLGSSSNKEVLGSFSDQPPLKKPQISENNLHLGSSKSKSFTQLGVDSDCGFEVVRLEGLCHSPKSKGKQKISEKTYGAESSESMHNSLINLSDSEDEGIGFDIVKEGVSLRESEPGSSKASNVGRTSFLTLLKCSETLCGKV